MSRRSGRSGRSGRADAERHQFSASNDTRQMLGMAVELHQAGQLGRAKALYEQILAVEPEHADALQFLGLLKFQNGEPDAARQHIERAIAAKPKVAPYHDNLGKVLESQGRLDDALRAFERAATLEPGIADRSFNMGVVSYRLGRLEDAERHFRDAVGLNSEDAEYHVNLANVQKALNRHGDAIESYRRARTLRPQSPEILSNLGHAMMLDGDTEGAIGFLQQSVESHPAHAGLYNSLGNAFRHEGQMDAAVTNYRRAVELDPASLEARRNLGSTLFLCAQFDEAVRTYLPIRDELRNSSTLRREFVAAARYLLPPAYSPALASAVLDCMGFEDVHPQVLAHLAARVVCLKHGLDDPDSSQFEQRLPALMADPLLRRLLESSVNVEPTLERALTDARRALLTSHESGDRLSEEAIGFTCALGQQCFTNEFVYPETADEAARVTVLVSALQKALESTPERSRARWDPLCLIALYRPLHGISCAAELQKALMQDWPAPVRALVARALLEPLEEARLCSGIVRATPIDDDTSRAVRAQYEANPYPRWLSLPCVPRQSYADFLRRRFPHFDAPKRLEAEVEVLVLGCGTGQEAIAAATGRSVARVSAVDLSLASLAYGCRMAQKLGVERIEFLQADALTLDRLETSFDVIESSGVLHHLQDPLAGWGSACARLAPGGVMKVGLYSERARADIVAARSAIESMGLVADPAGIREFRCRVLDAPDGDPLANLAGSEDLYTLSACRDLLFHVCERRFSPLSIRDALGTLGLEFIGFELPHAFIRARYREFNPADARMTDLEAWERFEAENPDTFAAMYVFWCHKPR